jgi:hypothetical protein
MEIKEQTSLREEVVGREVMLVCSLICEKVMENVAWEFSLLMAFNCINS